MATYRVTRVVEFSGEVEATDRLEALESFSELNADTRLLRETARSITVRPITTGTTETPYQPNGSPA